MEKKVSLFFSPSLPIAKGVGPRRQKVGTSCFVTGDVFMHDSGLIREKLTRALAGVPDLVVLAQRLATFLSKRMPVERLIILEQSLFPPSLQVRGECLLGDLPPHRRIIFMTRDFMSSLAQSEKLSSALKGDNTICVINNTEDFPFLSAHFGAIQTEMSYLFITLAIPNRHLYVSVNASGINRFNKEHEAFAALLPEPLTAIIAAHLRHQPAVRPVPAVESMPKRQEPRFLVQDTICGFNKGLAPVMQQIYRVAATDTTVLLMGETGTGKELFANALHRLSRRASAPFIKVNCGAIPETLIDSELFGYERGAFTGAVRATSGWFERADNGTLLLDEIGEMPLQAQVRLLRVLQFGEIVRLGGARVQRVNVRIVASTHCDLERMVAEGTFRQDLWFRLSTFPVRIPPLRERRGDVEELAMLTVARKCYELHISPMPVLDNQTLQRMNDYDWPGNVRELESVVEQALIRNPAAPRWEWPEPHVSLPASSPSEPLHTPSTLESSNELLSLLSLDDAMKDYIQQILDHTGGQISGLGGAADILQINAGTLRSRMFKLSLLTPKKKA